MIAAAHSPGVSLRLGLMRRRSLFQESSQGLVIPAMKGTAFLPAGVTNGRSFAVPEPFHHHHNRDFNHG